MEKDGEHMVRYIRIRRESVCMGDDVMDHELEIGFDETSTLEDLIHTLLPKKHLPRIKFLPSISGDKATWVLTYNFQPLAVIAQEWEEPKYLVNKDEILLNIIDFCSHKTIDFQYLAQIDPDVVFKKLNQAINNNMEFTKKLRLMELS